MEQGKVQIYSGTGKGKSAAAIGRAVQEANLGKKVVIITFLKGIGFGDIIQRLEPEIKVFRFEKSDEDFEDLSIEHQQEEIHNIRNGMNFAKKVLTTGECNLLILDEVLGLIDNQIITVEEIKTMLEAKLDDVSVILTGRTLNQDIKELADEVSIIETEYR